MQRVRNKTARGGIMVDESHPYLTALRRTAEASEATGPSSSAVAAALAPEVIQEQNYEHSSHENVAQENPGRESYAGAEKRRSWRYKCEGSAEIREEGHEVRTWATFTDISLHGCYVEAAATYPVGTALEIALETNGVRVQSRCTVRVNYPYLGMGIAFDDMSEENLLRLKDMLATLSTRAVSKAAAPPQMTTDAESALVALRAFFEQHSVLTRTDFRSILDMHHVEKAPL